MTELEAFSAPSIIAGLTEQATALHNYHPSGDELVGEAAAWCGQIRLVERKLAEWRQQTERAILEESGDEAVTVDGWQVSSTPKREWLVNTQRLIGDLVRWNQWDPSLVLHRLVEADALEMRWKITNLRKFMQGQGLSLDEKRDGTPEDVAGSDGPHAARVQTGSTISRERVE